MKNKKRKTRDKWSVARWKKEAKKVFQRWVRLRDMDNNGFCKCCSCDRVYHWKELNAGHFIPAEWLATCFDERNCHAQCVYCNKGLQGNTDSYFLFMEKNYGRGFVEELVSRKHNKVKLKAFDYQEIIETYSDKCVGLEIQKGVQ